jgi:hypothetical protein
MTKQRMIELLEIEHECMLRKSHDVCDGNCCVCELVQDDYELHEMYINVISTLKAQEPVKPYTKRDGRTTFFICGGCNELLCIAKDSYKPKCCPECGRAVKWE